MEDHLADIRDLRALIEEAGIETANTRIARYIKYLENLDYDTGLTNIPIFNEPLEPPYKDALDLHLYVLRELHELMWIAGGLKMHRPKGLEPKLRLIVKGSDFAALDRDSSSRNAQFELRIASYFCRSAYEVDLSTNSDILASSSKETFHVECKRVASPNQLNRRIREAEKQLRSRLPRSTYRRRHYGIVALDVTKVAFEHNGLTWAFTVDHSQRIIREKLEIISSSVAPIDPAKVHKNILLTWLQIHIPALIRYPPQCTTRLSNNFSTHRLGGARLRAFNRLRSALDAGGRGDERQTSSARRKLRNGITIPAGTAMAWDEALLDEFVDCLRLPSRRPEDVILTLTTGENKHEFYFMDIQIIVSNLDEQLAMFNLVNWLIALRFPYEDDPDPFDSSSEAPEDRG